MSYEDEDDLNKWLGSQASSAAAVQPEAAPDRWAQARDLMQRQQGLQYKPSAAVAGLKAPTPEAAPERDDWKTVLAMAMSLMTKQGRGNIGQVMMAGEDQYNRRLENWRGRNSPEKMLQQQAAIQQIKNADRQGFEADRKVLGDQASQAMQIANHEQQADNHLDSMAMQQGNAIRQEAQFAESGERSDRHFDASQGLTREQMAQQAALAAAQRAQAASQFRAGQDFTREQHELTRQHQTELNNADNAVAMQRAAAAAAAKQRDNTREDEHRNRTLSLQQSEQLKPTTRLIPDINRAMAIIDNPEYENDLPGVGTLDGNANPNWTGTLAKATRLLSGPRSEAWKKDDEAMRLAVKNIVEYDLRDLTGAGSAEAEQAREMLRMGGNNEKQTRLAIRNFKKALELNLRSRGANGNEGIMRGILEPYGWAGIYGPTQPTTATTAGPAAPAPLNMGFDLEEDPEQ